MHLWVVGVLSGVGLSAGVQCLCTDPSCPTPICSDEWCLVGVSRDETVVRRCRSNSQVPINECFARAEGLDEACLCRSTDFCNTFAFYRERVRSNQYYPFYPPILVNGSTGQRSVETEFVRESMSSKRDRFIFEPEPPPQKPIAPANYQDRSLIVVLVMVPLGVGGVACIILVGFSYSDICGPKYSLKRPMPV